MPVYFQPISSGGGGGGGNAFGIVQPPAGTSPTASASSDTLTFTSTGSTVTITGNSGTKTINFDLAVSYLPLAGGTLTGDLILTTAATGITIGAATSKTKGLYIKPGASAVGIQLENANNTRKFNIDVTSAGNTLFGQDATNGFLLVSNVATGGTGVNWFSLGANGGANPPSYPQHFNCISGDGNVTALSSIKSLDGNNINGAPWVVLSNANSTVNTIVGWVTTGSSKNPMSFVGTQNRTQTAASEVSDLWFATQKAGTLTLGLKLTDQGQLAIQQTGAGLSIKSGANCKQGTSVLVGGTVTVNNTSITSTSIVQLTHQVAGGTVGTPTLGTVVAGTSFVINSTNAADTSTIGWTILEQS